MKFELPRGATAGLVIRAGEVELLAMKGKAVTSRVRVAINGKEDAQLVAAIRRALEAAGLKTKRLAVSIPSQDVLFRFFTVPTVPKAELDAVVQFEARKYIPFKTDTLVWDYHAMPAKGSNQLEVVFSAVSRELFRQLQDVLASAGVQPILVEPGSVSLARLVEPGAGASPDEFVCVVEVEQDVAHLAIVKHHVPYLTRDIIFSAPNAPEAEPPAEQGQAPAEADAGHEGSADPRSQRVLSELSVCMNFFLREYPSTTITRVILFGEEGVVGPWCQGLSDQLRCAVEMGHACVDPRVEGGLPLAFASALGLLEAAKRPAAAPVDFLRRNTMKPALAQRLPAAGSLQLSVPELLAALKTPQAVVCIILAACALGGLWFLEGLSVSAERSRLSQLVASQQSDIGSTLAAMTQVEVVAAKQQAETQLAFLKQAIDHRLLVAAKLDAVARALPEGVWLTNVSFEDSMSPAGKSQFRMAIRGACFLDQADQELSAIHKFEEQVKRHPAFFTGSGIAQVDHIDAQTTTEQYVYRAFQLNYNSGRTM